MAELSRDRGIVLRTQDHAETDRIAVLLTPRGRLDVLAKGARRLEGSGGAVLDPLHVVDVIHYRRRGLHLLKEASLVCTFPHVRGDLERATAALKALAWVVDLVPVEAPDDRPYALTLEALAGLDEGLPPPVFTVAYLLRLLGVGGHAPHLCGCVRCGALAGLTWSPEGGGLLCVRCGGRGEVVPPRLWRSLDALARLPGPALARLKLAEEDLAAGIRLLEEFRAAQLGR
ncbi:MAG TPA: DNA repair protein RecO [Candidatus Bipolaricaulis sp.]|nr:DNA repair protein RecO [Candidatus Bipolaricaulis sp.]HPD07362.1 DNA repair protein RecO [Candidatus Bipolaricaulis sp.]HRS14536.1 DNA repair protein RecO [Candidatus Bipolaricaulis sp.]HRU22252.1 DNA repair protein RecO [Candidatus Bipolaricaulis sp.]